MSDKLQQAIQATRAGDNKNAQFLLTQAIQEDPGNSQAWYLLSLLVDDKEKKQVYLTKVIELDPDHTKAHEQLVAITETAVPEIESTKESEPEAAPVVLSSDSSDLEAQDGGETLPDWMADDLPPTEDKEAVTEIDVISVDSEIEEEVVPDWLEGSLDEEWSGEEKPTEDQPTPDETDEQPEETTEEEKKEVTVKKEKPAKKKKEMSQKQLNYMLIGLVIVTIIIFFIMAYLIFNM